MTPPDPRVLPLTLPTTCPDCLGPKPPEIVRCCSCQLYLDDPLEHVRRNRVALPDPKCGSAGNVPQPRKLSTQARVLRRERPEANSGWLTEQRAKLAREAKAAKREREKRARQNRKQRYNARSSKIGLALG